MVRTLERNNYFLFFVFIIAYATIEMITYKNIHSVRVFSCTLNEKHFVSFFSPPTALFKFPYRIFYIFLAKLLLIHRRLLLFFHCAFSLTPCCFFPRGRHSRKDQRAGIKEIPLNMDVERAALPEYVIDINIYHTAPLSPRNILLADFSPSINIL